MKDPVTESVQHTEAPSVVRDMASIPTRCGVISRFWLTAFLAFLIMVELAWHVLKTAAPAPPASPTAAAARQIRVGGVAGTLGDLGITILALGSGGGAELRHPFEIAVIGGLIVSQVLTLYTTPVVYLHLDRLRWWKDVPR